MELYLLYLRFEMSTIIQPHTPQKRAKIKKKPKWTNLIIIYPVANDNGLSPFKIWIVT